MNSQQSKSKKLFKHNLFIFFLYIPTKLAGVKESFSGKINNYQILQKTDSRN